MTVRTHLSEYAQGKKWRWYIVAWLFGLYLFVLLLDFELGGDLPFMIAVPQAFNFFLHEIAHLLFAFLPDILVALAGSASELILGLGLVLAAFLTRSYFASLFCVLWFMLATQSVADYIGDARSQALPLVSFGGGDPTHDWHFILDRLGLLAHDQLLAGLLRGFGIALALASLGFAAWLIYCMATSGDEQAAPTKPLATDITLEIGKAHTPKAKNTAHKLYPNALRGPLSKDHEDTGKD